MRHPLHLLALIFCLLSALAFATPAFAQTSILPGDTIYLSSPLYYNNASGDGSVNTWGISGASGYAGTSQPNNWGFTRSGGTMTITIPATASPGAYTASYCTKITLGSGDTEHDSGYVAAFTVSPGPATLPAAGMPAFSWQGSVAGVNTGNGNKTTTLPITGWTMRGGMTVSCALIHNSQGASYSTYGYKWLPSYFTYLSVDGSGNETIHWDNGLSYLFTNSGGTYTPIRGVLDKLVSTGNNTFTLTTPSKTVYTFGFAPASAGGNTYLSAITDLDGNTLTINHTPATLISSLVDPTGRTLTYTYDGTGRLGSITDPLNRVWTFTYDGSAGSGNLWYVTLPSLNGGSYADWFGYDGNHNITGQESPQGHVTGLASIYGYDTNNPARLTWAKDPVGNQTTFTYNPTTTVIADPNGHTLTHTYQYGRLISTTDALGNPQNSSYDSNNILVSNTDRRKHTSYFSSHLSNGTTTSTSTDALTYSSSTSYDTNNKPVRSVDAVGNVTANSYTGGDLTATTITSAFNIPGTSAPFKATSSIGGYTNGLPSTLTDANSNSTSLGYDPYGYPSTVTDASAHTSHAFYNVLGWKIGSVDANGHATASVYDNWGRVVETIFPDSPAVPLYRAYYGGIYFLTNNASEINSGEVVVGVVGCVYPTASGVPGLVPLYRLSYPPSGDHFSTANEAEKNYLLTHGYSLEGISGYVLPSPANGWQPLYRAWNGATGLHLFTQDVNEYNALSSSWAKEGVSCYVLSPSQAGSAVNTTYDLDGDVLTVTDADNHTVTNVYDGDDRVFQTTNGRGDVVKYGYDGSDPIIGVPQRGLLSYKTDGNQHATYYSYTVRNEPYVTYYPDGTQESVTYDNNGNTLTRNKADGSVIGYAYDADNRLTDITYPHMTATHFDYDADGRRTHMHDATGDTNWLYGDGLHLLQVTTPQGQVNYGYDLGGRRTTLYEGGVGTWVYQYYNNNLLYTLQSPIDGKATWQYDAANRLTRKTKGNGDFETYAYDAAGQTTGIGYWFADGILARSLSYAYTPAGSIQTRAEGNRTTTYGYDGADQLTGEATTGDYPYSLGYSYDGNGNRLTQTSNGSLAQQFTYDAHDKLTGGTAGGETDGYDANGNETSVSIYGSAYRDTYDDEDRLVSVALPGGVVDTFTYNGLGLRVGKTDSTGTYAYVCDGTSPGSPVLSDAHAVYNPGLSESRAGTLSFYDFDQLGSLWTMDAGAGDSTPGGGLYTAFGTPILTSNLATPFRYGGAGGCQTDPDTGLVLMGHRYYDSRIGRFLTQDPAGDGDNWYAYCGNDPVDNTDPEGLDDIPTDIQQFTSGPPTGYDSNGNPQWTSADGRDTWTTYLPKSIGDGQEHSSGGFQGLLGFFDNNLTFGTGAGLNRAIGAFHSGHGSGLAVAGAGLLFAGAVAVNFVPGEEEANLAAHGAEDLGSYLTKEVLSQSRVIAKGSYVEQAERLAGLYGGKVGNWVKKSTGVLEHPETGADVEIHWFENLKDNIGRRELKRVF